jgi:hypothetical protein
MWASSFPLLVVVVALGHLPAEAFHRHHQELLAAFPSIDCFFALAEGCVRLAPEVCESLVCSLRTDNGCVLRNVPTSLEALSRPPSICLARCKLGLLRRGQTDDGGVDVVPLLGGIILHVLHALLPLVLRCESVGDVLALLMFSFRAGLGVASSSVFSSVGVALIVLVVVPLLLCFLVLPRLRGSPEVAYL